MLELIMLDIIVVYLVVLSGIVDSIKSGLKTTMRLKPFDCPLCMCWWCNLLYIWCVGEISIFAIMISAVLSFFSEIIVEMLHTLKDLFIFVLRKLNTTLWKS